MPWWCDSKAGPTSPELSALLQKPQVNTSEPLPPLRRHRCTTTQLITTGCYDELLWVCFDTVCVRARASLYGYSKVKLGGSSSLSRQFKNTNCATGDFLFQCVKMQLCLSAA